MTSLPWSNLQLSGHHLGSCITSHICDFNWRYYSTEPRHYWARHFELYTYIGRTRHPYRWNFRMVLHTSREGQLSSQVGRGDARSPNLRSRSCKFHALLHPVLFSSLFSSSSAVVTLMVPICQKLAVLFVLQPTSSTLSIPPSRQISALPLLPVLLI